jgi:hypothetical protein
MATLRSFVLSVLVFWIIASPLKADDYDAMMQQSLQQSDQLTQQMQQAQTNLIQQNLQNPQVQAMYQQHLAQGGTMTPEQFAYNYAATGGFSREGMINYNRTTQDIQQRDQAAINAYRDNQQRNYNEMQNSYQRNDEIAHQRGNLLNGTTDYVDPNTGAQYNLSHTAQPNSPSYNPNTGESFYPDNQGNYQRIDQNGWQNGLEEVE